MFHKKRAFTLVEILLVLFIVALLASIVLVAVGRSKYKARDAQRKSDIAQIQKGLELYFSTYGQYPAEDFCDSSRGSCATTCPCAGSETDWDYSNAALIASRLQAEDISDALMVDPVNDATYHYWYEPSCNQGMCVGKGCCAYTVGALLESDDTVYSLSGDSGL